MQPPARQREHLLCAAVGDKKDKETSAFAQIQFTTRIQNHKKVSPGFI